MSKTPISFEQHKSIGPELHRMRERMLQLFCIVVNAGPVNRKSVKLCEKVQHFLDEFRSEMEEEMYRGHREASKAYKPDGVRLCTENSGFTYIYYPGDTAENKFLKGAS